MNEKMHHNYTFPYLLTVAYKHSWMCLSDGQIFIVLDECNLQEWQEVQASQVFFNTVLTCLPGPGHRAGPDPRLHMCTS